jgi:hypothetical protein
MSSQFLLGFGFWRFCSDLVDLGYQFCENFS